MCCSCYHLLGARNHGRHCLTCSLLRCNYIPLLKTDQAVITETQRQADAGMDPCLCSNCNSIAAGFFLAQQKNLTLSNFTDLVLCKDVPSDYSGFGLPAESLECAVASPPDILRSIQADHPLSRDLRWIRLFLRTQRNLKCIFDVEYPKGSFYTVNDLFSPIKLWTVFINYDFFLTGLNLDKVFGSEPLPNAYRSIMQDICEWKSSRDSIAVLHPSEEELKMYNAALAAANEKQCHKDVGAKTDPKKNKNKNKVTEVTDKEISMEVSP